MSDPFDIKALRIDPTKFSTPYVPAKIQKRNEQFVILPMWWYERLKAPVATGLTCLLAFHLLHLNWKNRGKPFKLPNGTLRYDDGVSGANHGGKHATGPHPAVSTRHSAVCANNENGFLVCQIGCATGAGDVPVAVVDR